MIPTIWGATFWNILHELFYYYPDNTTNEIKNKYKQFIINFQNIIPCETCQTNFSKHLLKYPISNKIFLSKNNLLEWSINIHNEVNIMHNKHIYTLNEYIKEYEEEKRIYGESNKLKLKINIIFMIRIITGNYLINNKKDYSRIYFRPFIENLIEIIPYEDIKIKIKESIKKYPIEKLKNNLEYFKWYKQIEKYILYNA